MSYELQAAYQHSQMMQLTETPLIIPPTMFAVVVETLAYCPLTDATLPNPRRALNAMYGSRRVAEYYAQRLRNYYADMDARVVVFPRERVTLRAVDAPLDCPF